MIADAIPDPEARALELEALRRGALIAGDAEALAGLVRDDALYVHANGSIVTGKQWAADLASGVFRYEAIEILEQSVMRAGDCVVLVFAQNSRIVIHGEVHASSTRSTAVWAPHDDDMRLIAYQTSHVDSPEAAE